MTKKEKIIKGLVKKEIERLEKQLTREPKDTVEPEFWEGVKDRLKTLRQNND